MSIEHERGVTGVNLPEINAKQATHIHKRISDCHTVADAMSVSRSILSENQANLTFNDPIIESKIFVEHAFDKTPLQLITHSAEQLHADGKTRLYNSLLKRIEGHPMAYIVGHQSFWTLSLAVSPHTLIPRADSEVVVETAIALPLPETAKVLDLGTGTGAIALAIKAERGNWEVSACDYTDEIVDLAESNAERNKLEIDCVRSDWFADIPKKGFDLIVSNPPYVESNSMWLVQGDVRFEPDSALTSGIDGLDDIRHIILHSIEFLNQDGYLLLEHGHEQASSIQQLLSEQGYIDIATIKDLNGLDRASIGRLRA